MQTDEMTMNLFGCETTWFEPLKDESLIQTPRYKQVSSPRIIDPNIDHCSTPRQYDSVASSSATSSTHGSQPNSTSTPRRVKSVSISTPHDTDNTSSKPLIRHNSSVRSHKVIGSNHWQKSKFDSLRQDLLKSGTLYKDCVFPADSTSLSKHSKLNIKNIKWQRPYEISKNPKFCSTNFHSFDIEPGKLGDTNLLSALTCLSATPELLKQCIPSNQDFDDQYAGIFHFRFWRFGEWIDVVIDDLLPTVDGHLLYMRSTNPDEFWPSLFEKAYAKLYGSYENIHGGRIDWALQDTTGGIASSHDLTESPRHILTVVDLAMNRASLVGAFISPAITDNKPAMLSNGLKSGHTYRLTGFAEIPVTGGRLVLLRLHNQWHNVNWKGAWNPCSPHWKALNERTRRKMKFDQLLDGEFWISFNDFKTIFTTLEVCYLGPESWKIEPSLQHRGVWAASVAHRRWVNGFNAAGCVNPYNMCNNTQFYFEIDRPMTLIISLMHGYRHTDNQNRYASCSCLIYKVRNHIKARLGPDFFTQNKTYAVTRFKRIRENTHAFLLPEGAYLILPVTEYEGREGKYMLRFYSAGNCDIRELDDTDKVLFIPHTQYTDNRVDLLRRQFRNMTVANKYRAMDATALQKVLSTNIKDKIPLLCCFTEAEIVNFKPLCLSLETCKAAITIFDTNVDGRLGDSEFNCLISRLVLWQNIFRTISKRSEDFSSYLLRNALSAAGFHVSNKTLETLIVRFSSNARISLDQFICILIKLCTVHYAHQPSLGTEYTSTLSELLQKVIYS